LVFVVLLFWLCGFFLTRERNPQKERGEKERACGLSFDVSAKKSSARNSLLKSGSAKPRPLSPFLLPLSLYPHPTTSFSQTNEPQGEGIKETRRMRRGKVPPRFLVAVLLASLFIFFCLDIQTPLFRLAPSLWGLGG